MTLYPLLLIAWLSVSMALICKKLFISLPSQVGKLLWHWWQSLLYFVFGTNPFGTDVNFVSVNIAGLQPGADGVVPAETVQCIRPMPSWTGRSDVRPKPYDRVASAMFKRQPEANDRLAVKTDDTIIVQGQVFPVHRRMLAHVSSIFDTAFQCDLVEGAQLCSPCVSRESVVSISR